MKKFIFTFIIAVVFSSLSLASGKFMFKPEKNMTKETHTIEMGVSIYENLIAKRVFLNHYTGLTTAEDSSKPFYEAQDFTFKNGLVLQPVDMLQFEVGHEWHKNLKSQYTENIGYMKVSAQLW